MNIAVELNSPVEHFQILDAHKQRIKSQWPSAQITFCKGPKELKNHLSDIDLALLWVFPEKWFQLAPKLKHLFTPAAGQDWVAEDPSQRVSTHYSSFHGKLISESFASMLLSFNHGLNSLRQHQIEKNWNRNQHSSRRSLHGQSLLIIGCGNIGEHCARLAQQLGMEVYANRRSLEQRNPQWTWIENHELHQHLPRFDHILNLLPGHEDNEAIVDAQMIEKMSPRAIFYNFGRGTTVDEGALVEALQQGKIQAAGLDVTKEEPLDQNSALWTLENVILSPHSSCCYQNYLDMFLDETFEHVLKHGLISSS